MDTKLQGFLNKDNCFFIHYASDGFYNGSNHAPKISCIVLFNDTLETRIKFSIDDYIDKNSIEQSEILLLKDFKAFIEQKTDICFIHWNMDLEGFGFKALTARVKELGIVLPTFRKENLFDLASYVAYLSEKRLSIKQILWFNSFLDSEFLDGKTEAEYFKLHRFKEIADSVSSKTVGLSYVAKEIQAGTVKTEKPFKGANDGLTKEERRKQALKIAQMREQTLKDIVKHNLNVLKQKEMVYESHTEEQEEGFLFFDSEHPLLSLFASWFGNK